MNWDIIDENITCYKFKSGLLAVLKHESDDNYTCSIRKPGNFEVASIRIKAQSMDDAQTAAVAAINKTAAATIRMWFSVTEETDMALDAAIIAKLDSLCRDGTLTHASLTTDKDRLGRIVDIDIPAEDNTLVQIQLKPKSAGAALTAVNNLNIKSLLFMNEAQGAGENDPRN